MTVWGFFIGWWGIILHWCHLTFRLYNEWDSLLHPPGNLLSMFRFFLAFLCKEVERSRSTTEQRTGAGTDLLKDHFIREDCCCQDMSSNLDLFELARWTHTHERLQPFFHWCVSQRGWCWNNVQATLCQKSIQMNRWTSIQFKCNHCLTDRDHRLLSGMTETAVVLVVKTVHTSAGSKHAHIHSLWGSSRPFLWFWHVLLWCVTGCQPAGWEDRDYPWLTLCFRQVVLR